MASATVLMVKATTEGSRQVLILASRKREIMVRDAFSGLLLRTMCEEQKPTIYSLLLERSFVYCGTSDKGILVLDFNVSQFILFVINICVTIHVHFCFIFFVQNFIRFLIIFYNPVDQCSAPKFFLEFHGTSKAKIYRY